MHASRWSDLLPELLHEITGHLHDPTDFVRFHAVCRPWRSLHEPTSARKKTTDQFLPWLLAPNKDDDFHLNFRCVFSKISYLAPPPPTSGTGRNWVASADGTAVCYFTSNPLYGPTLHDPLTGTAMTHLPRFLDDQWKEENPSGIIYNDGTVLLYTKHDGGSGYSRTSDVRAALLRPDDDEWTVIQRKLEYPCYGECCVAYRDGKILVTVERSLWLVIPVATAPSTAMKDVLVHRPTSMPLEHDGYEYEYTHVLESRGELLWASVHISVDYPHKKDARGLAGALLVLVHALEDAPAMRWVKKKAMSLADRVLFLGWPNSFAVDASQLGVTGGFVYFMHDNNKDYSLPEYKRRAVFRYNLNDNTTEFVDWLPEGWNNEFCTWLIPQPIIAPIHKGPATTPRRQGAITREAISSPGAEIEH